MSPAGRPHVGRRTVLVVAGCLIVGVLAVVAASRLAAPEEAPAGDFSPVVVPSPGPTTATPSPSPTTPSPSRSTPGSLPGPVQATPSPRTVEDDDDDDDHDDDDDDDRDDKDDD